MSNIIAPARNYFLNMQTQKKANLAWRDRRPAQRNLLRPLLQVSLAPGDADPISVPSNPQCTCTQEEPFLQRKRSGQSFLPIHRTVEDLLQQRSPRWLQDWCVIMIKKNDNLMQQFIGTQWGRNCWKRYFSEEDWVQLNERSSKTRFEYCEDSKNSLAYFRTIQGLSGGITIAPELMGAHSNALRLERVSVSQELFLQHSIHPWERTHCRRNTEQGGTTDNLLHTSQPFRRKTRWRSSQWWLYSSQESALSKQVETQSRCRLSGKTFPSTRSRIAILADEMTCNIRTRSGAGRLQLPSNLAEKDRSLFERLSTPRPARKVTHRSKWHSQQHHQWYSYQPRETCCGRIGKKEGSKQHDGWSDKLRETCAVFCVNCWQEATIRNRSSRRSISRCHLTRRRKDERNQHQLGKIEKWIMHKIPS